jgi:TfoX/Sxy family transcriptional regulator of competence genes
MIRRLHFSKTLRLVIVYYKNEHKLVDAHDNYHSEAREKIKSDELPVLMLNI